MIHLDRNQINLVLVEFIFQIGRSRSFFRASASARHRSWFYLDPSRCDVQLELAAVSTRRQKNQQKPNRPTEDVWTWGRASVHAAHAAELTPTVCELPRLADMTDLNKNLIPAQWNQICGSCLTSVCRKPAVSWSSLQKSYFFTQIFIKYDLSAGAENPFK